MKDNISQVPATQKVQPEVKDVSQTSQQPPVALQTPSNPAPPPKSKKRLKTKILVLIISLALIVLGIAGYFYFGWGRTVTNDKECADDCVKKSGVLNKDEVWSGTIHVTGDINVISDVTLTILPGTTVLISANNDINNLFGHWECDGIENYDLLIGIKEEDNFNCGVHKGEPYRDEANHISIMINGTLKAIGTEEDRIVFKSDSPHSTIYDWNHFDIHNGILSYADVENYRVLETKGDVEISHNNLKNMGECGVCANSDKAKILFNKISYAGHELIDMHDSSPFIHSNHLGPNPNRAGIIIDGGSPQITANKIEGCGGGINFISLPDQPIIEDNVFLNNLEDTTSRY
jgi:hypothetical protein